MLRFYVLDPLQPRSRDTQWANSRGYLWRNKAEHRNLAGKNIVERPRKAHPSRTVSGLGAKNYESVRRTAVLSDTAIRPWSVPKRRTGFLL